MISAQLSFQAAIIHKNEQRVFPSRPSNGAAVQRRSLSLCSSLISCVKSASPFWREARVRVRRSSGRPEASTPVITWRKLGENLRCRNGSNRRGSLGRKLHLNLTNARMVPPPFGARLIQAPFVPTPFNCCKPGGSRFSDSMTRSTNVYRNYC